MVRTGLFAGSDSEEFAAGISIIESLEAIFPSFFPLSFVLRWTLTTEPCHREQLSLLNPPVSQPGANCFGS